MNCIAGVDIGGTSIKAAVLNGKGQILCNGSTPTPEGGEQLAKAVCQLVKQLEATANVNVTAVGVGCPGLIDSENGVVVLASNLKLEKFPLGTEIQKNINLPVKITNDANAAALGEARFGAGKNYSDSVMITLGTGVGGGIVVRGKLLEGYKSAGGELGHMIIERGGEQCSCGKRGCFEAYSSASALIKRTRWAMEEDAGSAMWKTYTSKTACGKTAFEYEDCDLSAKEVVDWYINYLACGIVNIINILRPEAIILGGGVAEQGEKLLVRLRAKVERDVFGGIDYAPVEIVKASLGNLAGSYGAAALFL